MHSEYIFIMLTRQYLQFLPSFSLSKTAENTERKRFMKMINYKPSLLVVSLVVITSLLYYLSSNPFEGESRSLVRSPFWIKKTTTPSTTKPEHRELVQVLKKATMADRTVILTTLNGAWASPGSVIDLFLESFEVGQGTKRLLNHLVILATDQKAYNRCILIHPHCLALTTPGVDFTTEKRSTNPDSLKLMWRRIELSLTVLELGYSFIFTDADIMWLRNPFPHFGVNDEFTIACDSYSGDSNNNRNRGNGHFMHVRSTARIVEIYKYWYMSRVLFPKSRDQTVFEHIKTDQTALSIAFKVKYLDTAYFGGFCEPSTDMNKVITMHANCCVGIEKKIHDLRLVLEDWKNFTALSTEEKRLRGSFETSPWRAPNKCKQR